MWNHKWKYAAMVLVLMGLTAVAALLAGRTTADTLIDPLPVPVTPSDLPSMVALAERG